MRRRICRNDSPQPASPPSSSSTSCRNHSHASLVQILFLFVSMLSTIEAFAPLQRMRPFAHALSVADTNTLSVALDEDVKRQLFKARALLEKAKNQLEEEGVAAIDVTLGAGETATTLDATPPAAVPFFFASLKAPLKRDQVVKSINENGLITTDGEKMASMSEQESWEVRPLDDVFRNEAAISSMAGRTLSERDAAAGIFALRRQLHDADFTKIFDKRNRFIGDLD